MVLMDRVILMLLDGVGVGALPDAHDYGDEGTDTLGNLARAVGGIEVPELERLGLGWIEQIEGVARVRHPAGSFGKMREQSAGKDSISGHWEIAGIILREPFPTYPRGFPPEVVEPFQRAIGRVVLGNVPASGTEIIERLGREHLSTGSPILYTSADSVFQLAAHEDVIPVEELYRYCRIAREQLVGAHLVARVIARPFVGTPGSFRRTERRRDYSVVPPQQTLLDILLEHGESVVGIGKVDELFAGRGLSDKVHTVESGEAIDAALRAMREIDRGLVFVTLVEFDMLWGHRNDCQGFQSALEAFDRRLPELLGLFGERDCLFITADHGNDPTTPSTDHSREYVPLLAAGPRIARGRDVGIRDSFSDLGASIAEALGAGPIPNGRSFFREIVHD
jgi:phosphopentomutase